MTDLPRLPKEREPAFWSNQRQLVKDYADPGPDLHTRPTPIWRYVTLACLVAFAGWILMGMAARAAEREPRVWQMWAAGSDKPFHPHKFASFQACLTDIAFVRDDGGKRLSCIRVDQKKE